MKKNTNKTIVFLILSLCFSAWFFSIGLHTVKAQSAELFTHNLLWGMKNNQEVKNLQIFLTGEGLYSGDITGNYFRATYKGVQKFQIGQGIRPVSGYFGPATRAKVNAVISSFTIVPVTSSSTMESVQAGETQVTSDKFAIMNFASYLQARISALYSEVAFLEKSLRHQRKNGSTTPDSTSSGSVSTDTTATIVANSFVSKNSSRTLTVNLSSQSPSVTNSAFSMNVTFSRSVTGFISSDLKITNGTISNFSGSDRNYSFTITPTVDGLVTVDVPAGSAKDSSGNTNTAAATFTRVYDHTPPAVTGVQNDFVVRKSKTWAWSATETGAVFRYSINTTENSLPSVSYGNVTSATLSAGSGTHYLHVQARDIAGNASSVVTVSTILDNSAPILLEVMAVPTPSTNPTPSYIFSSSEAGTILYGGDCMSGIVSAVSGNNTVVFNTLSFGTHSNCTIKVTDGFSNQSTTLAVSTFAITTATSTPPPPTSNEISISSYTTAYTYWDNTPPGSSDISNPIIHQKAGGVGTYVDPITLAVGHSITNGIDTLDYAAGTIFYIPNLRRYFIVEDTCGDGNTPQNGPCHTGFQGHPWIDLWIDGVSGTSAQANSCANAVTDVHLAIMNPAPNYAVVSGPVFQNGSCSVQYEDPVVAQ